MTQRATPQTSPVSRLTTWASAVVLALGGLTGAGAGAIAALDGAWTRPDTFVVFFGVCSLVAALLGVLVLIGKLRETAAMTLLIAAGTLLVGGALSEAQLVAKYLGQTGGEYRVYFGVRLATLMLIQLACAGLGVSLCAVSVWTRRLNASTPHLLRAAVCGVVFAGLLAVAVLPGPREAITGAPKIFSALAVIVGGVLGIVALSIGGHALIRSFEVARG